MGYDYVGQPGVTLVKGTIAALLYAYTRSEARNKAETCVRRSESFSLLRFARDNTCLLQAFDVRQYYSQAMVQNPWAALERQRSATMMGAEPGDSADPPATTDQ